MSSIPELLRKLASEIENEQIRRETDLEACFHELNVRVSDVDIRAHKNEDKLHRIGKILMED